MLSRSSGGIAESSKDSRSRTLTTLSGCVGSEAFGGLRGRLTGFSSELQGILYPNPPRVRLVTARGTWYTLEPDGTFRMQRIDGQGLVYAPDGAVTPDTTVAHPWDWDSHTVPALPDQGDPFRIWAIIYAPTNSPLNDDEGAWGDYTSKYGDFDKVIGTSDTFPHVEQIRGLIDEWRAAGIKLSNVIIAYDPNSFNPAAPGPYPAAGMPDGYWGQHGKVVDVGGGALVWQRSRNPTARYYRGVAGTSY
ncbi:MAG: hypothetical protein QM820_47145 [Minicystis sp.]